AQFDIGAIAGANLNKIDGKSFKEEFNYGYDIGGFAEIGLSEKFMLQQEVLVNQYNTTVDSSFGNVYQNAFRSDQSKVTLSYLSIPVLLNYKLLGPVYIQAGPQIGILIDQNKNLLENGEDAFKSGDFSMLGGVHVKLAKFRVTGRYVVGLNNINDIDNRDKWKNQGIQLSVGIAL